MIKGSIEDRMEYEDYIRSLKDTVRYPFHKIYRKSEIIERYYLIKIAKEKRGFDLKEKRILNLMTLMDYVVRVGGIVYAWWWEEFLPKIISQMSNSKAEWVVSMDDIAKTFNCVPTKTVEAALLKTTALPDVVLNCLNAQRAGDLSVLAEQLCHISPDEIFESFKVIDAYKKICDLISEVDLADDKADRKAMYLVKDTLDVISPNETFDPVIAGNKLLNAASSFEIDENDVLSHPEKYLRAICLGLSLVRDCLNEELGESDPVAQTIREILDEEHFQRISNFYIQFPRDEEWCQTMCKKIMQWEKEYLV